MYYKYELTHDFQATVLYKMHNESTSQTAIHIITWEFNNIHCVGHTVHKNINSLRKLLFIKNNIIINKWKHDHLTIDKLSTKLALKENTGNYAIKTSRPTVNKADLITLCNYSPWVFGSRSFVSSNNKQKFSFLSFINN